MQALYSTSQSYVWLMGEEYVQYIRRYSKLFKPNHDTKMIYLDY